MLGLFAVIAGLLQQIAVRGVTLRNESLNI